MDWSGVILIISSIQLFSPNANCKCGDYTIRRERESGQMLVLFVGGDDFCKQIDFDLERISVAKVIMHK